MDKENSAKSCTYEEENQDPQKNLSTPNILEEPDGIEPNFDSSDEANVHNDQVVREDIDDYERVEDDYQEYPCTPPVSGRPASPGAINHYSIRRNDSTVIIEDEPFSYPSALPNRATALVQEEAPCTPPVHNRFPSPGAVDRNRTLRPLPPSAPISFRVPDFQRSGVRLSKENGVSLFGNSSKNSDIESPNKNTDSFKQREPEPSKVYFINIYVLFCWYFIAFIKILVYYKGDASFGVKEVSVLTNFLRIQCVCNMDRLRRFIELVSRNSENKVVIIVPDSANDKSSNICFLIKIILHCLTYQSWNDKNLHVLTVSQLGHQNETSNCGIRATFNLEINNNPSGHIDNEMWRFERKVSSVTFGLLNFYDLRADIDLCFISENFHVSASRYKRVDPLVGVLNLQSIVSLMAKLGMSDNFICSALSLTESTLKLGWDLRAFKLTQEQEDEIDEELQAGLVNLSLDFCQRIANSQ